MGGRQLTHPDRRAEYTALVALVPLAALIYAVGNLLREATFPWNEVAGLPWLGRNVLNMTEFFSCHECPAFGIFCEGASDEPGRCLDIEPWLEALNGLALDMPLSPQPQFDPSIPSGQALPPFFPQLLNGLVEKLLHELLSRSVIVGLRDSACLHRLCTGGCLRVDHRHGG